MQRQLEQQQQQQQQQEQQQQQPQPDEILGKQEQTKIMTHLYEEQVKGDDLFEGLTDRERTQIVNKLVNATKRQLQSVTK